MTDTIDFNHALESVNGFGLYQKLLIALLIVPSAALSTLVYLCQFFVLMVPDHWCNVERPENFDGSDMDWKKLTLPFNAKNDKFEMCEMYDLNSTYLGLLVNQTVIDKASLKIMTCNNGFQYDFSSYHPTIATDLNWVCEDDRVPYLSQTIYYVGTSIGTMIFGHITDRYGRKPTIILSYLIACIAGISSSFATSFLQFSILRFFVGSCIIPLSEDPYVLSLEYIGVKRRTLGIVFWSMGYIIFSAICPWISFGVWNWKILTLISSVPLAFIVLGAKWIPESASWLLMNNRETDAIKELERVAKVNGRRTLDVSKRTVSEGTDLDKHRELSMLYLFKLPRLRKHTILLSISWFITYCCYHTNVHNTSNLGTDVYDSYTYAALCEAPVMFIILFGIDRFGRRWPMIIALMVAGITGLLILPIPADTMPNLFLAVGLIQRLSIATNYNIIMQYSAEIYPTVLRGRGLAFLRLMGTFGLYLSPSVVYLALDDPGKPLMISGIMTMALAVITLYLPETLNQNMPHTLDEGENFGRDQKLFSCNCAKETTMTETEDYELSGENSQL